MDEHSYTPEKRRTVNPMLGSRPKIGFLPAELAVPWAAIAFTLFFIVQGIFKAGFLPTTIAIAWGCTTWWVLTGSRPWRFLSKWVSTPKWTRGYVRYRSLFAEPQAKRRNSKSRKSSRKRF